jgi:hypothetical protein
MWEAVVLQLKLVLEGVKDIMLGPIALVAAAIDLGVGERPGRRRLFYRAVATGARFERWLNLYGALERRSGDRQGDLPVDSAGIDAYFRRLEDALKREHERGGLASSAKRTVDTWLDKIEHLSGRDDRRP